MTAQNVTSIPKRPLKDRAKEKFEQNKTRLAIAGAGALALATSFYAGKAKGETHFTIDLYNVHVSLEPGKHENITFKADMPGTYPMYCTEFCSALHLEMAGYLLVKPKKH